MCTVNLRAARRVITRAAENPSEITSPLRKARSIPPAVTPRRTDIGCFVLAVVAAFIVGPGGPIYWDSFGYVRQALSGHVGGLILGRPTFVLVSHIVALFARHLGVSPFSIEARLRVFWLLVSALGAPATARLSRSLGLGNTAAAWSGVVVALSPALAHTSDAVLTDAPSMAITTVSLALAARSLGPSPLRFSLASGIALGVAMGLREQAVATLVPLAWLLCIAASPLRRLAMLALGVALSFGASPAYVFATQPGYASTISQWFVAMAAERAHAHGGLRDLAWYLLWVISLGPLSVVFAGVTVVRWVRDPSPVSPAVLAVCVPALVQLLILAAYQDIAFSPRYLLATFPSAIALPCGIAVARCRFSRATTASVVLALGLTAALAAVGVHAYQAPLQRALRQLPQRLREIPADAVVVTGQLCPAVVYYRVLAQLDPAGWTGESALGAPRAVPAWRQVCPGWRWPRDLNATLEEHRAEGRTVVIDLRAVAWVGRRQQLSRREAMAYVSRHGTDARVTVWADTR